MKRFNRLFGAKDKLTTNICSVEDFRKLLEIERGRTHRNGHEFSLVVLDLRQIELSQRRTIRMIQKFSSRIRNIDQVGWYDNQRIGFILPYTSSDGAKEFIKDIIHSINGLKNQPEYTLYTYPPEKKLAEENSGKPMLRKV